MAGARLEAPVTIYLPVTEVRDAGAEIEEFIDVPPMMGSWLRSPPPIRPASDPAEPGEDRNDARSGEAGTGTHR